MTVSITKKDHMVAPFEVQQDGKTVFSSFDWNEVKAHAESLDENWENELPDECFE